MKTTCRCSPATCETGPAAPPSQPGSHARCQLAPRAGARPQGGPCPSPSGRAGHAALLCCELADEALLRIHPERPPEAGGSGGSEAPTGALGQSGWMLRSCVNLSSCARPQAAPKTTEKHLQVSIFESIWSLYKKAKMASFTKSLTSPFRRSEKFWRPGSANSSCAPSPTVHLVRAQGGSALRRSPCR